MYDFSDLLVPAMVVEGVTVAGKKPVLANLAGIAAAELGLDPRRIAERLAEREKLGSTGFGGGIAIPHARLDGLTRVVGLFAKMATPVDFDAVDELPVDLLFVLLSPPDAGVEHLKALARVSRALRDKEFVAKLRGSGSPDALYALLTEAESRDAA